jgi:hypothetical protein
MWRHLCTLCSEYACKFHKILSGGLVIEIISVKYLVPKSWEFEALQSSPVYSQFLLK